MSFEIPPPGFRFHRLIRRLVFHPQCFRVGVQRHLAQQVNLQIQRERVLIQPEEIRRKTVVVEPVRT